jgi:periplasmic copper chaperone A
MRSCARLMLPVLFCTAVASPAAAADVTVADAWFRALPGGLPAGGYFTLHNLGSTPIELTGAESSACGMLMLHESTENGGVSRMTDVHGVTVPAGGSVEFAPGGYHLMCMNPGAQMTPGKTVLVNLAFGNGARIDANFAVKNAAGK